MGNTLPTFMGYTVDRRLGEFRRCKWPRPIVYIPFDSDRGRKLFEALERNERR